MSRKEGLSKRKRSQWMAEERERNVGDGVSVCEVICKSVVNRTEERREGLCGEMDEEFPTHERKHVISQQVNPQ